LTSSELATVDSSAFDVISFEYGRRRAVVSTVNAVSAQRRPHVVTLPTISSIIADTTTLYAVNDVSLYPGDSVAYLKATELKRNRPRFFFTSESDDFLQRAAMLALQALY